MAFTPLTPEQYTAARQKFSADQIVQFEQKRKADSGGVTASSPTATKPDAPKNMAQSIGGFLANSYKGFSNFANDFASAGANVLMKDAANTADFVNTPFRATLGIPQVNTPELSQTIDKTLPIKNNAGGLTGEVTGTILPYLIPASGVTKVEKGIDTITKDAPKIWGALARIFSKAVVEGATTGAVTAATTNNVNKGINTGVTTGVLSGVTNTVFETLKATGLPQKLMGVIFKDTKADTANMWKALSAEKLQKENPTLFADYVKKGLITVEKDGTLLKNDSLALRMLNEGVSGSLDNMGIYMTGKLRGFEDEVQTIAKTSDVKVTFENSKNLKTLMFNMAQSHEYVSDGSISQRALGFAAKLDKGEAFTAKETLQMRRLLDDARKFPASGAAPTTLSQQNLQYWSNQVRAKVNDIPGMGTVMDKYSTYIEGLKSLLGAAQKAKNAPLVTEIQGTLEGLGLLTGDPAVAAAPIVAKTLKNPRVLTGVAQMINGPTSIGGVTTRAAMSLPFSGQGQQSR